MSKFLTVAGLFAFTISDTYWRIHHSPCDRWQMGMNHPYDDYRDKLTSLLDEKPAPVPLLSPRIAHGLIQEFNSLKPGGNHVSQQS
jgi:hypothetical protein